MRANMRSLPAALQLTRQLASQSSCSEASPLLTDFWQVKKKTKTNREDGATCWTSVWLQQWVRLNEGDDMLWTASPPRLKYQKYNLHFQSLAFSARLSKTTAHRVTAVSTLQFYPLYRSDLHTISSDLGHSNLTTAALPISISNIYSFGCV